MLLSTSCNSQYINKFLTEEQKIRLCNFIEKSTANERRFFTVSRTSRAVGVTDYLATNILLDLVDQKILKKSYGYYCNSCNKFIGPFDSVNQAINNSEKECDYCDGIEPITEDDIYVFYSSVEKNHA